jgi:hypothetical protein
MDGLPFACETDGGEATFYQWKRKKYEGDFLLGGVSRGRSDQNGNI